MTKKGKLIGSIVVLLFIAIMIPVAIFATTRETIQSTNCVKFNVVDFQGNFYLALIGNKQDLEKGQGDIGQCNYNTLTPAPLFTAKYSIDPDTQKGSYSVFNVYEGANEKAVGDTINFPDEINIEFDSNHLDISYYFIFVNTATNNIDANDNRDVLVTTKTQPSKINNLTTNWRYSLGTTYFENQSSFILPTTWTNSNLNGGDLETPLKVQARNSNSEPYHYIILNFNMTVSENAPNIDSLFTITIQLVSDAIY